METALVIDDKVLKGILKGLYYPDSPYEFSVLPAEILGQVYEQFLGKVITLTGGHRARIEEKPEVKKAGGVYYTPSYIVDYIVQNTVGRLVEGKTPEQVSKLRILDPACGSGSFLLGAYQYLLDWHLKYYTEHEPEKWLTKKNPPICEVQYAAGSQESGAFSKDGKSDWIPACAGMTKNTLSEMTGVEAEAGHFSSREGQRKVGRHGLKSGGTNRAYKLTVGERKRILLNNLYGVDIDAQAVEVTKLSLLLKVLEGEKDLALFHRERALPDLGHNIQCGNSLIGTDFYKGQQGMLFDEEQRYKINAFDWEEAFPEVFSGKNPGFDAVIGNPPWGVSFTEEELRYFRRKFSEVIIRMVDSFMYFISQSIRLLKQNGIFGMIVPDVLLYQNDNQKVRDMLINDHCIITIINLGNVFNKVTRPACIVLFQKELPNNNYVAVADFTKLTKTDKQIALFSKNNFSSINQKDFSSLTKGLLVVSTCKEYSLLRKITRKKTAPLVEFTDEDGIQRGVSPDLKEAFIVDSKTAERYRLEKQKLKKVLTGGIHVKRYTIRKPDLFLIYTARNDDFRSIPNICHHIDRFKSRITCKEVKQKKHPVYSLHRAREERIFLKKQKLIGVITEDEIILSLDEEQYFATDGLYLFGTKTSHNIKYIMGILNSKMFKFLYRLVAIESGRVLAQVKPTVLNQLPIRKVDFSNAAEKAQHDRMVELVERMLELNKRLQAVKTPDEKVRLERQITATDREIDELVYELYGLTEEEKRMVEEAMR
ncbi:MAG: N-6 DNA methylase [Anaerohalosphaeraceae bacterium]